MLSWIFYVCLSYLNLDLNYKPIHTDFRSRLKIYAFDKVWNGLVKIYKCMQIFSLLLAEGSIYFEGLSLYVC